MNQAADGLGETSRQRRWAGVLACGMLLAGLTLGLHGSALQGGLRLDDPMILLFAVENPDPIGYFSSPQLWQRFGVVSFTPWLVLDFWLDHTLAGLSLRGFYAHHLLVLFLTALATFVLLKAPFGPAAAAIGAALFVAMPASTVVAQQLMSRHYVTGLLLAILAILAWLRHRRKPRSTWWVFAVLAYLGAVANKEIFLPLPLLLLTLDRPEEARREATHLAIWVAASVAAWAWRAGMLGASVGGYDNQLATLDVWARQLSSAIAAVLGGAGRVEAVEGLALGLAAVGLWRLRRQALAVVAGAIVLALPYLAIPASDRVADLRFMFLPSWALCALVAAALSPGHARGIARAAAGVLLIGMALALAPRQMEVAQRYRTDIAHIDAQTHFIFTHGPETSYVPIAPIQFQYPLHALREMATGRAGPTPVPFPSVARWLGLDGAVMVFDPACGCLRPASIQATLATPDPTLPVQVRINRAQGEEIVFESERGARCFLQMPDIHFASEMPCQFQMAAHFSPWVGGSVRFFALRPDGRWNATESRPYPEKGQMTLLKAQRP